MWSKNFHEPYHRPNFDFVCESYFWWVKIMNYRHCVQNLRRFGVRSWKTSGSGMYFDRIGVLKYLLGFWLSSLFSGNDLCLGMPNILDKPEISGNIRYFGLPKISTNFQNWIEKNGQQAGIIVHWGVQISNDI